MSQRFNRFVGIGEADVLRATHGAFKPGIELSGWGTEGAHYIHGFGHIGQHLAGVPFDQYWRRMRVHGCAGPPGKYTVAYSAAEAGRFMHPEPSLSDSPPANINSAYHFDAGAYTRDLRTLAEGAAFSVWKAPSSR